MISVLYVDDEEFLLDIGKTYLERSNEFTVDICSSAAEALDKLKSRTYDAVVSDYQMPEMDGIEFLTEVRARFGKIPFILFTGKGREEVVIKAINSGADSYIQKGGEPKAQFAELAHKIRRAVEQSQALKALTLNEERMRLAIEGTDNGIWEINSRDRTVFMNDWGCGMLGYTLEEIQMSGLWWTDVVSDKDRADIYDIIAECIKSKKKQFRFEKQFRKKSGEWIWVRVRGSIIEQDEQGNPIRLSGTTRDITDKKQVDNDLIQAKRDWETIFRAIKNPAFIVDNKQRIIDANQAVLSLTGTTIDEISLMNYHQFLIEKIGADRADLYRTEKTLEHEDKVEIIEIEALGRTYLISATPFFDVQGEFLKRIFFATDITENKQMKRALTDSRDYLNQIFTSVREGILIIDAHSHEIIDANPAAIEMIGAEREEVIGNVCNEYLCPDEQGKCPITDLHQSVDNAEQILVTAGGSHLPIIKSVTPFNLQGRECLLETFIDNSERKAAEEKLLASYERISAAEEEIRSQYKELADAHEALRQNEARFRAIVETSPDVIWEIDLDGRVQYMSPRIHDIVGYTPEEVMGMSIYPMVPQTSIQQAYNELNKIAGEKDGLVSIELDGLQQAYTELNKIAGEKDGLVSIDVEAIHRSGDVVPVTIRLTPIYNEERDLAGFRGVVTDISNRRKAEKALKESEARFRAIVETSPDVIWETDLNGRIQYVSPRVHDMHGYTPEEVMEMAMTLDSLVSQTSFQKVADEIIRMIEEGGSLTSVDLEAFHRSGDVVHITMRLIPLYDEDHSLVGFRGVSTDISNRKKAEKALKESEARFRDIVETSPDIIWEADTNAKIQYVSPRVREILGYTPEEIMNMTLATIFSLIPQTSTQWVYDRVDEIIKNETSLISIDVDAIHRSGDVVHLTLRMTPRYDEEHGLVGFRGVVTDISDRKHAEEALRESEIRFRQVAENAGEWIWEFDEKGMYRYSNSVAEEIVGYTKEELIGVKHFWELFPPTVDEDELKELHAKLQRHKPFRHINRELIHKDGKRVILKTSGMPYCTKNNDYLGYRGISLDVTDQIRNEKALQRVNHHLSLLSSITRHDIRNLLTPLWGYVYLIEETSTDNAEVGMYIEGIKSTIQRIQNQIEFTGIYQDIGVHEPTWQSLTGILQNIHPPEGVKMNISVENIEVRADQMFKKVFENFLDNSIRHGKDVSVISVSTESAEDELTLVWEDDGGGIPDREKEIIFERGYGKNSGFGLFLIRDVLLITGIEIKETGKEGEGVRFEMLIPRKGWRYVEERAGSTAHIP